MSSLNILKEILEHKYRFENQNCLIEENIDNNGKKFTVKYDIVKNNEIDYELFRYSNDAFPFFKNISGLKKMCDFILFSETRGVLYIFVIELKLSNESAKKQLEAATEFVKFILNSSKRIDKEIINYKIKKIRICDNKTKKRNKMSAEKGFDFDENNFCDYSFKSLHLEPLMRY